MALTLPQLHHRFEQPDAYHAKDSTFSLLPFRFISLDQQRVVLTNFSGEYVVLPRTALRELVQHSLRQDDPLYDELKSRHFLFDGDSEVAFELLAAKYRTKHVHLAELTRLFIFVVTLRCDHTCQYCQVSRQSSDKTAFDMTYQHADQAVELMFDTPAPTIKIEFQGGESLLNFPLIRHIVLKVKERNVTARKNTSFIIATNLYPLTDEHLAFCRQHDICLSTSLDGPRELHNRNRPHPNKDSYEAAIRGIQRAREVLGMDRVSALMTTTEASLPAVTAIIDEYVAQGFQSIFLRSLSPYGFAARGNKSYPIDEWLGFYGEGLEYILTLNKRGVPMVEQYAAIILRKMLTPFATGYVDLQSPAGMGLSALVFNYDGGIYASDEARMLAEMGDHIFRLGTLGKDTFASIMHSEGLLHPANDSMAECVPMCADCGFLPYCGSDPVFHHATQGDAVGFKPTSGFCRKNMGVFRKLITLLEDDPNVAQILKSWAR